MGEAKRRKAQGLPPKEKKIEKKEGKSNSSIRGGVHLNHH